MSVGKRIASGYALALAILVIVGAVAYRGNARFAEDAQWVTHTYRVMEDLQHVLSLLKDAETGQRGYIITGDDNYLAPDHAGINGVDEKLKNLQTLTGDNPNQQPRLDKLKPLIDQKFQELAQTIALRKDVGFDAALEVVTTDAGKQIMGNIRQLIGEMDDEERSLLKARTQSADTTARVTNGTIVGGSFIALLLVGGAAFWITRSLTRPVNVLVEGAKQIGGSDLGHRINVLTKDELGELSQAFNKMAENLQTMVNDLTDKESALKQQFQTLEEQSKTLATQEEMLAAQAEKNKLFDAIRDAVRRLAGTSTELRTTTAQQATGAQEQAAAISQTVATAEEVARAAHQAAEFAKSVAEASRHTDRVADTGYAALTDAIAAMDKVKQQVESIAENVIGLAERAQAIGEITARVNDIAEQTNVLALNAAVEASRAGEHGKGFAVVASEVKSLAVQAKQATVQVRQILAEIQQATNSAVLSTEQGSKAVAQASQVVDQAGEAINKLRETIGKSARTAEKISGSASQQASGVAQLNIGMQNIDKVTTDNMAAIEQIDGATRNLNALSNELAGLTAE